MQVNKYLSHIIKGEGKCETLQASLDLIESRKRREMETYLALVGRRLGLDATSPASRGATANTPPTSREATANTPPTLPANTNPTLPANTTPSPPP